MLTSDIHLSAKRKHQLIGAAMGLSQPFSRRDIAEALGMKPKGRTLSGVASTLSKLAMAGDIVRVGPDRYQVRGFEEPAERKPNPATIPQQPFTPPPSMTPSGPPVATLPQRPPPQQPPPPSLGVWIMPPFEWRGIATLYYGVDGRYYALDQRTNAWTWFDIYTHTWRPWNP